MYKAGIILLFVLYWLFAFIKGTEKVNFHFNNPRINLFFVYLFPPSYKMFTDPPRTHFLTTYVFYENEKPIKTITDVEFFNDNLIKAVLFFDNPYMLINGFFNSYLALNKFYESKYQELKNKNYSKKRIENELKKLLTKSKDFKIQIESINNLYKIIKKQDDNLINANRVTIKYERIPVQLSYETPKNYTELDFTNEIGRQTFYDDTIEIK